MSWWFMGTGCDCRLNGTDPDPNCIVCHTPATTEPDGPGCNQCNNLNGEDYFKIDYNYTCTQCQKIFEPGCHCTDFLGVYCYKK